MFNPANKPENKPQASESSENQPKIPSISLPKGGGAIRGIGEKFAANPVTGTGSLSFPIFTSPGRSGFGPQLSLSYDSGSGNGPFGFGWNLSVPCITRKTDKGLPKYQDAAESDVFMLSGAEDLVPAEKTVPPRTIDDITYRIKLYRPRIEGLFARIECWTNTKNGDIHWRSISRDNILTIYGRDKKSCICDPANESRIFSWLICETRDDKGNAVVYEYKPEDGTGIDLSQAHERNRGERLDKHRTANRYLKRVKYGNRIPLFDDGGHRPQLLSQAEIDSDRWMFEVVFDYDDHDPALPKPRDDRAKDIADELNYPWKPRKDPFSSYRAGFEVRTCRLCQRVLMFHHFPDEEGIGADCLVHSTDFSYSYEKTPSDASNPIYSFLLSVQQTGYKRTSVSGYLSKSLPPIEFEYSKPIVNDVVEEVDSSSLENLPVGIDGAMYQWTDLHGEGIPGILTEQGGAWFYKRNLSPIPVKQGDGQEQVKVQFAPIETVALKPNLAIASGAQFMDLAGDGQPDLVVLDSLTPGFYEHDDEESWQPFRSFTSQLNRNTHDPNLKFVDLDGDGHADVLITEDDALVWHASLAEEGFGPANRVAQALDEEKGPRLIFADGTQSIYLADMSGDGLTDLVRIRNGEVCYWPNLGYCRFGSKVTMDMPVSTDQSPYFDNPDQFDQKRIRLADIDGSGTTDIIYLHRDGVRLYFNQSGNSWSAPKLLKVFPRIDDIVSIVPIDLLGNGTACLVWSSPLPGDSCKPLRYVNLMGGQKPDVPAEQQDRTNQKPHLLTLVRNNLGAETHIYYAPSTKFYLQDKRDGKPWITRLPFPVHVVERVETYDRISCNRFVTRYAYHHGYFDGEEREFRGFGMVEQWDTENIGNVGSEDKNAENTNFDAASFIPPVRTRTWFHTGIYIDRNRISNFFAGLIDDNDLGEYYREPAWRNNDAEARKRLLDDTVLPDGLTIEEEREACRSLKGSMLRQEVYALDGTDKEQHPYTVTEQNFTIRHIQPQSGNRHAVFFTHAREAINYHYERNPEDPRITHSLTLDVDDFGNVLSSITVGYPRANVHERQPEQNETHITLTLNRFTNRDEDPEWRRIGMPVEARTYEVVKPPATELRFTWDELYDLSKALIPLDKSEPSFDKTIPYEQWDWRKDWNPQNEPGGLVNGELPHTRLRLIEHVRTLYNRNSLDGLLKLGKLESLALPGESYKLAFTPGLLSLVYQRKKDPNSSESLLVNPIQILRDEGGYILSQDLKSKKDYEGDSLFPSEDPDDHWWIPSGKIHYWPNKADDPKQELSYATNHFFLPHRFDDPFGNKTLVFYDNDETDSKKKYNLLLTKTIDALENTVLAQNDYRVLQPKLMTDPNGNRSAAVFDILGMVVGTAVMGKVNEPDGKQKGDILDEEFKADISLSEIQEFVSDSRNKAPDLLKGATSRIIYDVDRFQRCGQPSFAATLAREIHKNDPGGDQSPIQISVGYSDGFGREIQTKIQAEPGEAPEREPDVILESGDIKPGKLILDENGKPKKPYPFTDHRWVGKGRTVYNNKGKPVKQYEPFFSSTHLYEEEPEMTDTGVSPILFYDPVERVIATLHPNHTYEKVLFDPWYQKTYDVNDTVASDPRTDADISAFVLEYFKQEAPDSKDWKTWLQQRDVDPLNPPQDSPGLDPEKKAAIRTLIHADTPTVAYFDSLGRTFLTIAHNRFKYSNEPAAAPPTEEFYPIRVIFDIEGNQRMVIDAKIDPVTQKGRIVMIYDYDMLGSKIHQSSMEAGERWMLNEVTGKPIRAWDSRNHQFRTAYDQLRRPTESYLSENSGKELIVGRTIYGETQDNPEAKNLSGKVYQLFDQAGIVTNDRYDFKGNLLSSYRQLATNFKTTLDWPTTISPGMLKDEIFTSSTTYDALNRPIELIAPHSNKPETKINIIRPSYNEANLLERIEANLHGSTAVTSFVTNIDYNEKGQRTKIVYGSGASAERQGVTTYYDYDPLTFRLVNLLTIRNAALYPDDCPQPPPDGCPGCQVQNLSYTYDPAGNITYIRDYAQQRIFFRNKCVEPSNEYTYDAIYRLIEAKGREHLGQVGGAPEPHSESDKPRVGIDWSFNDGNAMGTYFESYIYDAVGNIMAIQHRGCDPAYPGWTHSYDYNEDSQRIEEPTTRKSNRLSSTMVNPNNPQVSRYLYDAHGNMIRMPHLYNHQDPAAPNMYWDYKDQLHQVDLAGNGGTAYYVYDATGQRIRKVVEKSPTLIEERIYLGGFEVFRRRNGTDTVTLERETLHIMDDKQRIALVETRTQGEDNTLPDLIRYQFSNHLGSASLELDDQAQIVTYEEYYPYGSTAYQGVRSQIETPKRYRYTGKERDEESGLYYHGARYFASWLGRWTASDPVGIKDDVNTYSYVKSNPVKLNDPSGTQNKPVSEADKKIMQMTDNQLYGHLKHLSPEERASFSGLATGAFSKRALAMLNKYKMERVYQLKKVQIEAEPPESRETKTAEDSSIKNHFRNHMSINVRGPEYSVFNKTFQIDEPHPPWTSPDVSNYKDVPSMVDEITELVRAGEHPSGPTCISSLVIWGHGREGSQTIGVHEEIVINNGISKYIPPKSRIDNSFIRGPNFVPSPENDITSNLARLKEHFCEGAEVSLQGCNVGKGTEGNELLDKLSRLWDVKIIAHTDKQQDWKPDWLEGITSEQRVVKYPFDKTLDKNEIKY